MGEPRPGRTVVISGDTAPCLATAEAAREAELLIHDAASPRRRPSARPRPATRPPARRPRVAREAGVKMLALVHISSRYHVGAVLEEAREVFERTRRAARLRPGRDPLPRARRARLVPNGARRASGEPEGAADEPPRSRGGSSATGRAERRC